MTLKIIRTLLKKENIKKGDKEMKIETLADKQSRLAMKKYNRLYDNRLYLKATQGKSSGYANSLIDAALALCGDPYFSISRRVWSKDAIEFLQQFTEEE